MPSSKHWAMDISNESKNLMVSVGWYFFLNEMDIFSKRSRIFFRVGGDMKSDTNILGTSRFAFSTIIWSLINGITNEKSSSILVLMILFIRFSSERSLVNNPWFFY